MNPPKNSPRTKSSGKEKSTAKSVNYADRKNSVYTILQGKKAKEDRKKLSSLHAVWYDSPEESRAAMLKYLPAARTVGEILENVIRKKISPNTLYLQQIQTHWQQIAGSVTARRCNPLRLYQKILYLEISHPAYIEAIEVPKIKAAILARIQELIGENNCNGIKYVPAGRNMPDRRRKPPGSSLNT